jgi:hypothetical protein
LTRNDDTVVSYDPKYIEAFLIVSLDLKRAT